MSDAMAVDVSQDWANACDVQQRFMDHAVPAADGIGYAARCRQFRALGGDCYDFLSLAHRHQAFAIGDASGKSLPAALMIANVQSSLRTAAFFVGNEPAAVLGAVNRQLHTASLVDRFATLLYGARCRRPTAGNVYRRDIRRSRDSAADWRYRDCLHGWANRSGKSFRRRMGSGRSPKSGRRKQRTAARRNCRSDLWRA
jgi:hypothetical protein